MRVSEVIVNFHMFPLRIAVGEEIQSEVEVGKGVIERIDIKKDKVIVRIKGCPHLTIFGGCGYVAKKLLEVEE